METAMTTEAEDVALADRTIRDLVETHPEAMTLFAPLGIDLCCGGAHRLGEALDLHGIDRPPVLARLAEIVGAPSAGER